MTWVVLWLPVTPADAAAYAALGLPPGQPWQAVRDAWRQVVKRHHPDRGACSLEDERRLLEANAAYAHLCGAEVAAGASPVIRRRRAGVGSRRAIWELLWGAERWPEWLPGVRAASFVRGASDRRVGLSGRWAGRRVGAVFVVMIATPPCRLSGRVLDLRVDGSPVHMPAAPRLWLALHEPAPGRVEVELGLELSSRHGLPGVLVAAADAALVELLELAAPPLL